MIASSRRQQIAARMTFPDPGSGATPTGWWQWYRNDVELLMYELERVEAELDVMTRDRNAFRAQANAERALRERVQRGQAGRFWRWLGL